MRTDLTPMAHSLALMFRHRRDCLSVAQIREQFPDADESQLYHGLLTLHRSGIVRRGLITGTQRVVYWFADAPQPAGTRVWGERQPSTDHGPTDADVGGVSAAEPTLASANGWLSEGAQDMADNAATHIRPHHDPNMRATVLAFNAVTGHDLTEAQGWLLLQILLDGHMVRRAGFDAGSTDVSIACSAPKADTKAAEATTRPEARDA